MNKTIDNILTAILMLVTVSLAVMAWVIGYFTKP